MVLNDSCLILRFHWGAEGKGDSVFLNSECDLCSEAAFRDDSDKEIERVKTLVTLVRADFVVSFGAVRVESKYVIKYLVP